MRCYYHPDREATGQCENNEHKVFLCLECCAQRIDGLCPKCAETKHYADALKRRLSAQIDIIIFAITAVTGAIWGASLYTSGQMLDFLYELNHSYFLGLEDSILLAFNDLRALNALFVLLILTYIFAATFLGAKFLLINAWRFLGLGGLIVLGFLSFLTIIIYLPIILTIVAIIGVFIMPFLLFGAYRTLCQPAPAEPSYNYSQPPKPTATPNTPTKSRCPNCGALTQPNVNFCPNCGKNPHQAQEEANATMKNWVSGST